MAYPPTFIIDNKRIVPSWAMQIISTLFTCSALIELLYNLVIPALGIEPGRLIKCA